MKQSTPQDFMHDKINNLRSFISNNGHEDVRWLNLIAAMNDSNLTSAIDIQGYHYVAIVELYKKMDELSTQVSNLAALIAEK